MRRSPPRLGSGGCCDKSPSASFHAKMKLQRLVLSQPEDQLSYRAKLVFVALIDCLNCKTGRLNPTRKTLAAALGVIPRTIQRGLAELAAASWFTRKLTRGAPYYSLAFDRLKQDGETHVVPPSGAGGETDRARWGDRFGTMGRHTLSHGTEKNRELKEKGEASPSPLNEASASLKKNGLQGEQRRRPSAHDFLFEKPKRWKAGDPDGELTEEEIEELKERLR
jgi:Helix-turn-helix domain